MRLGFQNMRLAFQKMRLALQNIYLAFQNIRLAFMCFPRHVMFRRWKLTYFAASNANFCLRTTNWFAYWSAQGLRILKDGIYGQNKHADNYIVRGQNFPFNAAKHVSLIVQTWHGLKMTWHVLKRKRVLNVCKNTLIQRQNYVDILTLQNQLWFSVEKTLIDLRWTNVSKTTLNDWYDVDVTFSTLWLFSTKTLKQRCVYPLR